MCSHESGAFNLSEASNTAWSSFHVCRLSSLLTAHRHPLSFRPASYFTGKRPLGVEEWKGENGCFITVHLQPPLIVLQPCNFVLLREEACTQVPGHWMVVKAITIAAAAANVHSPAPTRPAPLKCFTLHVRLTPT